MKISSIESLVRALNDAGVPFLVVGGLAVVAHGYGRQTQDVDLVVRLLSDSIRRAFDALGSLGYAPRVPVTAEMLCDDDTPVDLLAAEPFDFESEHAAAMVLEIAPGVAVRVVRLEALLEMKRTADRPQDRADIAELSAIRGSPDA